MIVKRLTKSCCGSLSYVFNTETPVIKSYLDVFSNAGYSTLPHFVKSGIFYVQKKQLIAQGSFGTRQLQVRCTGKNTKELMDDFEKLLDSLTMKK